MGLFGAIGDAIGDAVEAVGNAVEGAADWVEGRLFDLGEVLVDTWQGFFGSPVPPGGTNWNAYSHDELHAMLYTDANPGQVGDQSAVVGNVGKTALGCADEVSSQRRDVGGFWRGEAAGAFTRTLDRHHRGGTALGAYATALATAMSDASDALSRAQNQMPAPVDTDSAAEGGGAVGGMIGFGLGGPAGAAVGTLFGAGASWLGAHLFAANKKAEAVEVMQHFEDALHAADPPPPPGPDELPPGPDPSPLPEPSTPTSAAATNWRGTPTMGFGDAGGPTGAMEISSGPAPAAGARPARPAEPGTRGTAMTGSAALGTAAASASRVNPVAGWPTGPDGRASGPPVPWRDLVGRGSLPDLFLGPRSSTGQTPAGMGRSTTPITAGGRGTPGLPGTAALPPGPAGRDNGDREHRRRLPHKEKPFALDHTPPPPVYGA